MTSEFTYDIFALIMQAEALSQPIEIGVGQSTMPDHLIAQASQDATDAYPGWLDEFYAQKEPQMATESPAITIVTSETIAEEKRAIGLADRARNAWTTFWASVELPDLRFLAKPALAVAIATSSAACANPNAAVPSQGNPDRTPVVLPATKSPDASNPITLPPTEASKEPTAAPTPTTEPPPIPEPTAAPKPMDLASILEITPTKIAPDKVWAAIVNAWNNIPQFKADYPPGTNGGMNKEIKTIWDKCNGTIKVSLFDRQLACQGLILYIARFRPDPANPKNIHPDAYSADSALYNFAETSLALNNAESLKSILQDGVNAGDY